MKAEIRRELDRLVEEINVYKKSEKKVEWGRKGSFYIIKVDGHLAAFAIDENTISQRLRGMLLAIIHEI